MTMTGQGKKPLSRLISTLSSILLLACFFLSFSISAAALSEASQPAQNNSQKPQVLVIHSAASTLQKKIAESLSSTLLNSTKKINVSTITAEDNKLAANKKPDIIVNIGLDSIQLVNKKYPDADKLLIVSNPSKYPAESLSNKNDAILYMAQPYCRQLHFISNLSKSWQTIGFLNDKNQPEEYKAIQQCANKHNINTYVANTDDTKNINYAIKDALTHSDLLLALPNKEIFNSKTVKNILLTSYRYRKPVIAFSNNFVTAGALASIHSSLLQISKTGSLLIEQYLANNNKFTQSVNYPEFYDISINLQVAKALHLDIPDINSIRESLGLAIPDKQKEKKQ